MSLYRGKQKEQHNAKKQNSRNQSVPGRYPNSYLSLELNIVNLLRKMNTERIICQVIDEQQFQHIF